MAGGAGGKKQHGILFSDGIGFFHFAKKVGRVGKLGVELLSHFFADFVAATMDSGADGGLKIMGLSAKVAAHLAYTFLDDAFDGAPPTGMKDSDSEVLWVDEDNRETIGGLDGEKQSGGGRDEAVTHKLSARFGVDEVNDIGVNLA